MENKYDNIWNENYKIAQAFFEEKKHLIVPNNYLMENFNLGSWISDQRKKFKKGILKQYKIDRLNEIGMIWNALDFQWEQSYELAKQYHEKYNNLLIPPNYIVDNINLSYWIDIQRRCYKKKDTSKANKYFTHERIFKLEKIDMDWNPIATTWDTGYNLAKQYFFKYGNLLIPRDYELNNFKLGSWIHSQRGRFKENNLSKIRIDLLNDIDMIWNNVNNNYSTSFPEQYLYYFLKQLFPRIENRFQDFGFELDIYIPELKLAIEYDGEGFHQDNQVDIKKNQFCADNNIKLIRIREPKCTKIKENTDIYKEYYLNNRQTDNLQLGIVYIIDFINTYYYEKINKSSLNFNVDREKIYETYIYSLTKNWEDWFSLATEYLNEFGTLLIPARTVYKGKTLGGWISYERQCYNGTNRRGIITKQQIERLTQLGFVWNVNESRWAKCYYLAEQFYNENGHLIVPENYTIENLNIYNWLCNQRTNKEKYLNNIRYSERIDKLNNIGMSWNIMNEKWEKNYIMLKKYKSMNPHCDLNKIPKKILYIDDINLGVWIYENKRAFKKGKLDINRKKQLEELGIIF